MKIGTGLPTAIPGVGRDHVLEWSRRADAAGFSTLAALDRLVYLNWDPLVALGAAASVTERIGLMTAVLLLPYRQNAAVVAKDDDAVRELAYFREGGVDEVVMFPASADLEQVDPLARIAFCQ